MEDMTSASENKSLGTPPTPDGSDAIEYLGTPPSPTSSISDCPTSDPTRTTKVPRWGIRTRNAPTSRTHSEPIQNDINSSIFNTRRASLPTIALNAKRPTLTSQISLHELAKAAVSARTTSIGDVTFDRHDNLRESIRRIEAYSRRDAPILTRIENIMYHKKSQVHVSIDKDLLEYYKKSRALGRVDTDDIVGADNRINFDGFRIHYFVPGKGKGDCKLRRQYKILEFVCEKSIACQWIEKIQELVRWQARAPPFAQKRRVKVIINPHSGKRQALRIWKDKIQKFLDLANFEYAVQQTQHSGHAIEMGREYDAEDGFEALIFVGGDGTLCEFMNGLLRRPEHQWREIVAQTPISLISAGTQNAFGIGVGIPTFEAAMFCIIKRKMRPLDVSIVAETSTRLHYSYCGIGWGVPGDIAAESERYRSLGTSRYTFLKFKRCLWKPKKHTGRIRYVPVNPQPPLQSYHDIKNQGAFDQFDIEQANVYDQTPRKSWTGAANALHSPASKRRYPDSVWKEEHGKYIVVGVINTAPDGKFAHPSDGNLDLLISRKGSLFRMLQLGILYLFEQELRSPLITYLKVKAVEIETDQSSDCLNSDGEIISGPGPWRIEVIPRLFNALSEK